MLKYIFIKIIMIIFVCIKTALGYDEIYSIMIRVRGSAYGGVLYPLLTKKGALQERLENMMPEKQASLTLAQEKPRWRSYIESLGSSLPVAPKEQSKYARC